MLTDNLTLYSFQFNAIIGVTTHLYCMVEWDHFSGGYVCFILLLMLMLMFVLHLPFFNCPYPVQLINFTKLLANFYHFPKFRTVDVFITKSFVKCDIKPKQTLIILLHSLSCFVRSDINTTN